MYQLERLSNEVYIAVSPAHTFGTDAVLLADFAQIRYRDHALDLGTGCGIIPLLWLRDAAIQPVHCVEIQAEAVDQVKASVLHNHLEQRLFVHHCDLRRIESAFDAGTFSLVTMNPPYKPMNTGIESLEVSARIARHEVCCTVEDACKAAAYLLKFGGRFCMCHRPERLADVMEAMRRYKLEPKRLRFVQDKAGDAPFLFLIEGKKGAMPFLRVLPQLIIKKENLKFTDEMLKIYGSYAEGYDK